jgi:hypothetical protein
MEWFVIYNNEHLGPFSERVLHQLFSEGDLNEQSLIWREGLENAVTYEAQFLFTKEELTFKPLVQIVEKFETKSKPKNHQSEEEDDDLPPALPTEALVRKDQPKTKTKTRHMSPEVKVEKKSREVPETRPETLKKVQEINEIATEQIELMATKIQKEGQKNKLYFFLGIFLLLILIFPLGFYIKSTYITFSRPSLMSIDDYTRLKDVSLDKSFDNKFALATSSDRSTIWLSTNIPYEGEVYIKLKSIKDKTLSNAEIELQGQAKLRGKLVTFENWTFNKGTKLVDGYYNVEAYTITDLTIPLIEKYSPKRKQQFRFFDQVLISPMPASEFNKMLTSVTKEKVTNDQTFWIELKQKYETIKVITTQIRDEMETAFSNSNSRWEEELKKFELKYKREFGAFFTSFVIQNDESYEALKAKEFSNKMEIIANYTRLSNLAKDVGKVSMDIFHQMESFDGLDDARKENLRQEASQKLGEIIRTCEEKIQMIQTL